MWHIAIILSTSPQNSLRNVAWNVL
jgi:hypothetical protein